MSYFTIQSLRVRLGEARFMGLADDDGDGVLGTDDEARLQQAIDQACSEIDSHVGARYAVPLADEHITPALLGHVVNMIVYHLSPTGDVVSEPVEKRYEQAIKWASAIGSSKAQLGVTVAEPAQRIPAAQVTSEPAASTSVRTFSLANMRGLG